jgi:hypothetical protein
VDFFGRGLCPSPLLRKKREAGKEEIDYFWKTIRLLGRVRKQGFRSPNLQAVKPWNLAIPPRSRKVRLNIFSSKSSLFAHITTRLFLQPTSKASFCNASLPPVFPHFRSSNRRERGTARTAPKDKRAAVGGRGNTQCPRVRVREVAGYAGDPAGPSLCGGPVAAFATRTLCVPLRIRRPSRHRHGGSGRDCDCVPSRWRP